nr:MAG: hypothetical protein 3 [Leviviridae sp.]
MKSQYADVLPIFGSILADACLRWPVLRRSFEMDLSYLSRAIEWRGAPFFLGVLPAVGKVLDRGLADGYLDVTAMPKGIKLRHHRPELFRDLWSQVFDNTGCLLASPDVDAIAFLRQLLYCFKKHTYKHNINQLKDTLHEFFQIEQALPPSWPDTWDSDIPRWRERFGHPLWGEQKSSEQETQMEIPFATRASPYGPKLGQREWDSFRRHCRAIVSQLGTPNWWDLRCKHGPGVVSEKSGWTSKYEFPIWPKKLDLWFPFDWFGSGQLCPDSLPSNYEPPSRLIAVPKSFSGPRLICAEPLAHQWIQQGIWRWLEESIRGSSLRHSIDFRSQEASRRGALDASRDGEMATIDLSSASDRISTRLVEYVFQGSEILDGMHACRTRVLYQNIHEDYDSHHLLRKFSTQGSALTFPVQSIVFAIITVWALRLSENRHETLNGLDADFRSVRVFGDDIIAPSHAARTIKLVLEELGLKVNTSKSFWTGLFRESCGVDAFMGYDVTPAYYLQPYDGTPSLMATTVEVSNNFFQKGYWNTAEQIVSSIPPQERKLLRVCGSDDGAFGLRSFVGSDTNHLRRGWCPHLQRPYSISLSVSSRQTKKRGQGYSDLTQYFTEKPRTDVNWSAGQVGVVRLRKGRTRVYD